MQDCSIFIANAPGRLTHKRTRTRSHTETLIHIAKIYYMVEIRIWNINWLCCRICIICRGPGSLHWSLLFVFHGGFCSLYFGSCSLLITNHYPITRHYTRKPVYNDHLMEYFSAFWSYVAKEHLDELQKAEIVSRVNWYLQSSLKHITE